MNDEKINAIILAIVGPAGSGKDHMANYLREKHGIPTLVSYTTRPMRPGEVNGVNHIFIDPSEVPSKDGMIAYTIYGGYEYFTLASQLEGLTIISYVIDEAGLIYLMENFWTKYFIQAIKIQCSKKVRLQRGISQERISRDSTRTVRYDEYDWVTQNNGTVKEFEGKIDAFIAAFKKDNIYQLLTNNI